MAEQLLIGLESAAPSTVARPSVQGAHRGGAATGETRFEDAEKRAQERAALADQGFVGVCIDVGPSARGRLADVIDEAIERELSLSGAASPGIGGDADATLSDQLYRARRAGAHGLLLSFGSLRAASAAGALEADDSATLRFWSSATKDRPVVVLLDPANADLGAYGDPMPLSSLLTPPPKSAAVVPLAPAALAPAVPMPVPVVLADTSRAADLSREGAIAVPEDMWRSWVLALTAARGPQPLAAFERLFAQSYMPLANAIAGGLDDPRARQAHDEFRHTFEKAYTEVCPTFGVTGKRPKMVFDAPEMASRIARLHGARTTQLLLVDAMRFDLGARVRDALRVAFGARASLTDEAILWSALPSTTSRQLDLLSRGVEAFRAPAEVEREPEPHRGRTAETIRRIKIGHRDVFKLDIVEAKLREKSPLSLGAFDAIAEAVAEPIARHAATLSSRTLLLVFGDHGFAIDSEGALHHDGASPEEVLVPAFAFLVGSVH